ncbi:MAG: tetratricopeptide repeat protein [Terracidiphilus sp.]
MKRHPSFAGFVAAPLLIAAFLLTFSAKLVRANQANDEVTPEVQRLYAEAKSAQQQNDNATAIQKYQEMIRIAPHLAAAYNNLGMLYFNEQQYDKTVEVLKRGLRVNPEMPSASAMMGMSYFQLGDNEKAESALRAAMRGNPNDDQVEMTLCRVLLNESKLDEASTYLNRFLERHPKDQNAWYLLGKTYLQLSEDALKKINEIDPDSVVAHEIAGEIDASMHNYDLALVEYKKAIDKAPHQPGTHMHMGDAYWNIGKWESAETEFKSELENDPNNCMARWKLANSMLEANQSADEAVKQLNQSIEHCPTLMQAHTDRGRALIRLEKQSEALPDLLMAEKDSPSEPTIHFLLANVYRSQGKGAEALQEMQTYSRLQKEASEALARQASDATNLKNTAQ